MTQEATLTLSQSHTVLVVDDSPVARTAVRAALERAGYKVACTDNPLLVPFMLDSARPDFVLVDYAMPAVRGDMVMAIIRPPGKQRQDQLGLYLYSSRPAEELERLAVRCGADGFVCKDEAMEGVVRVVNAWFGRG